jgi:hypothetical protein
VLATAPVLGTALVLATALGELREPRSGRRSGSFPLERNEPSSAEEGRAPAPWRAPAPPAAAMATAMAIGPAVLVVLDCAEAMLVGVAETGRHVGEEVLRGSAAYMVEAATPALKDDG